MLMRQILLINVEHGINKQSKMVSGTHSENQLRTKIYIGEVIGAALKTGPIFNCIQIICCQKSRKKAAYLNIMNLIDFLTLSLALSISIALNGCAYSYVDESGVKHIIGLVNINIETLPEEGTYAGKVVDMQTVGITVNSTDKGGSIAIGYNRDVSGYIKDHALVMGNPFKFPSNLKEHDNNE